MATPRRIKCARLTHRQAPYMKRLAFSPPAKPISGSAASGYDPPAALIAHHLPWRQHLPFLACFSHYTSSKGAAAARMARSCSQGRCNGPSRPDGGEERERPRGPAPIRMAVDVAPASPILWLTAHIYIRGAGLGHAGLGRLVHPPAGIDQASQIQRGDNK